MTWANLLATGSGKTGFRLVIEGLGTQFVTDSAMEQTLADGRVRRVGLKRESIIIGSGSGIIDGKLKTDGFTAKIADVGEAATAAFATAATLTTFGTANINTAASSISVTSTAGWPTSGVIHIGTEACLYSGVTGTSFTGLTRGAWDTIAQAHFSALDTTMSRRTEVTNRPITIEGRRVYLFAYGEGDDLQGNGTAIFRGIVARDAHLDGPAEWSITVDGMSRVLEQDFVGPADGMVMPRGIYYPWGSPLYVSLRQRTNDFWDGPVDSTRNVQFAFTGFFETQDAFCAALEAECASRMAGWETSVRIISEGATGWRPSIRIGSTARWLTAEFMSSVDNLYSSFDSYGFQDSSGGRIVIRNVSANTTYIMRAWYQAVAPVAVSEIFYRGPGIVPRGTLGLTSVGWPLAGASSATFPQERIYLQGATNVATATALITGEVPDFGGSSRLSAGLDTSLASASSGYVHALMSYPPSFIYSGDGLSVSLTRTVTAAPNTGLAGLIQWIIGNSAALCNAGGTPLITASDFDPNWLTQVNEAQRGRAVALNRKYIAPKKGKFIDYLAEECKLLGIFPALNANGQIKFVPVRLRASTEAAASTIDASNTVTSAQWPGWERSAMGSLNEVVVRTGYNADEDKFMGTTYNVRDVTAYSRSKMPRTLEIAPRSECNLPSSYDQFEDIIDLTSAALGVFGRPYYTATVPVPWTLFNITPGDVVTVSSAQLPNTEGRRGVESASAVVLAKRFAANDAHGVLTLLVHGQNIAGYTPVTRKISQSNVSGNTWDVTVGVGPVPGYVDATAFQAGDRVRVYVYNSATYSELSGVVVSVVGAVVRVTFDSPWTPGSATWNLGFDLSLLTGATSRQSRWGFVALSSGRISYASSVSVPARTFAP